MIRRPPRSTRTDTLFPTRRSSDLGPNGQGVVSTPARLCAQIVAPIPPPGRIGVASQSGNFVSSFENYAVQTGVGISRAESAGNARSEEHTSELQSLMRISYAVFCLKKKSKKHQKTTTQ